MSSWHKGLPVTMHWCNRSPHQETTGLLQHSYRTLTGLLQPLVKSPIVSCQEAVAKIIEYLSFLLQCITTIILWVIAYNLYSLIKMANKIIDELLPEVSHNSPEPGVKQQKLIKCALTRNSKQYLGKAYTKEQVNKLSAEEVDKLFSNYEVKLSGQMVKSLGKSIIKMYSMGACAVLGMTNQDTLSEDLESDPILNSTLQRFTCEFYYRLVHSLHP